MKKLIIILFLFAFTTNAQIQLSEDYSFRPDKQKHAIYGTGLSTTSFIILYNKTGDEAFSKRASIMITVAASMLKEISDHLQGKEISIADMLYTDAFAIATCVTFEQIIKHRKRKMIKRNLHSSTALFSLNNEIFKK